MRRDDLSLVKRRANDLGAINHHNTTTPRHRATHLIVPAFTFVSGNHCSVSCNTPATRDSRLPSPRHDSTLHLAQCTDLHNNKPVPRRIYLDGARRPRGDRCGACADRRGRRNPDTDIAARVEDTAYRLAQAQPDLPLQPTRSGLRTYRCSGVNESAWPY